jgi:hypothetical protein
VSLKAPEGILLLLLRPATWFDQGSTSGNALDMLELGGQAVAGKSPVSMNYDNQYRTDRNLNNSLIDLSHEQIAAIQQAEANLTPQQCEQISCRVSIQTPGPNCVEGSSS